MLPPPSTVYCLRPTVTVVTGPAGCGKTWRLLARYRRVLAEAPPGSGLWLAPTHRAALAISQQVAAGLSSRGCLSPNVFSFDQLAQSVLAASTLPIRPLGPHQQRQVLKRVIDQALRQGELDYFGPLAGTRGFLDLLAGFIRELKRLEVWPEELARACGQSPAPKDRELCHLYAEYQKLLTDHHLYDAQGRFWSARALLLDGQSRPFERVRHVFVDGFTDFTRTEHEILEILAGRVETLIISLPLESPAPRSDLFTKTSNTLQSLRSRHGAVTVEQMPGRARNWPAMDFLQRHLFASPHALVAGTQETPPAPDPVGIEIIAASSARGEVELLAARIKRLLARGDSTAGGVAVRPGDVLVVFRSLVDVADLVRDVFGEYGIPLAIDSGLPLARVPELAALVWWLRLDLDDWPLERLLSLLVHSCFQPAWPEWRGGKAALAAEALLRRLQVPSGRKALLAEVERLAARDRGAIDSRSAGARMQRQARLALPLLKRVGKMLDRLPRRATPAQWIIALDALAVKIKGTGVISGTGKKTPVPFISEKNSSDPFFLVAQALEARGRLEGWLGGDDAELSRRELAEFLDEVLRDGPRPQSRDEAGRVRVLSAENARNLSAPYVFVAGLAEKAFPLSVREDCLMSEADIRRLSDAGLPLVATAERSAYEMLLFYEVITRATRRLVLSYAALDQAAQPLSPSPYLTEVERAFGAKPIERHAEPDLSPLPSSDDVLTPRDFRVRSVASALVGDPAMLVELQGHPTTSVAAGNMVASLRASCSRQSGTSFGPYEGMLSSAAARRVLGQRFGHEHCWSPSQLEQYAMCPHQFFLERVLGLEPIDEPMLATDYLGRGRMLHELLAALHRGLAERGDLFSGGAETDREFADGVAALVAELVARLRRDRPLADGLLEIDARRLSQWLARYRQQHDKYDESCGHMESPPRPAHFEVSFGPRRRRGDQAADAADVEDALSSLEPLALDCGGQVVLFSGRIDRIDIGSISGQAVFNIIDYKSGSSKRSSAKAVMDLSALQLPLYALAAKQLLAGKRAVPLRAAYWHVAGRGCQTAIEFHNAADGTLQPSDEWKALEGPLRQKIRGLVEGIRQGQFPMHSADEDCTSWCAYSTLCRVNQVRALGKTWQLPTEGSK